MTRRPAVAIASLLENAQGGDVAMIILLAILFVAHYLFADINVLVPCCR
jgi:hypothetical protein